MSSAGSYGCGRNCHRRSAGDRVGVVVQLLRKAVREAGEPAHVHPRREVLALQVGRRDARHVWLADDLFLARADTGGGAIAPRRTCRDRPVKLHDLGEVDLI